MDSGWTMPSDAGGASCDKFFAAAIPGGPFERPNFLDSQGFEVQRRLPLPEERAC
jgi:hypothetical protein